MPIRAAIWLGHVEGTDSACGVAFASGAPATMSLTHELEPNTRIQLHARGLRSVHSVPLAAGEQPTAGVVSTLHRRPPAPASPEQSAALDVISAQSATWLDWYQRTVVLDALERLHNAARTARLRHLR